MRLTQIDTNPTYILVQYQDGKESTVPLKDLMPCQPRAIESTATTLLDENTLNILTL